MKKIRIKLDLFLEDAWRLAVVLADDAHECERLARQYDARGNIVYAEFYRSLAGKSRMIKEALDLQIGDAKNIYIGGDEDESARA